MLGDQEVHLHAGEMHYFRIPEVHWEDRLMRLRAMGLNAVSTYVPWNWHEEVEGVFDFSSERKNLTRYLELAKKHGLLVIFRPGPYICSEWDFGGLPSWLMRHEGMKVRTSNPLYIKFVDRYWAQLLPLVRPQLLEEGGGIAAVLLENEFGHFGDAAHNPADREYLDHLHSLARRHLGPNVLLLTTDESMSTVRGKGSIPGVFSSVNMGPWEPPARKHLAREFGLVAQHNNGGPEFVMELWTGWFQQMKKDFLFDFASKVKAQQLADYVGELLNRNASFTLYMAHGGTNFGFWSSGALGPGAFVHTSYDYLAPISEAGFHTVGVDGVDKFEAIRKFLVMNAMAKGEEMPPAEPAPPRLATYPGEGPSGEAPLQRRASLRDPAVLTTLCNGGWRAASQPVSMEALGQHLGMILYRYHFAGDEAAPTPGKKAASKLRLSLTARDRVSVWQQTKMVTQLWSKFDKPFELPFKKARHTEDSMALDLAAIQKGDVLDILVENLGRRAFFMVNTTDAKDSWEEWRGLREAKLNNAPLNSQWEVCSLPLADLRAFSGGVPPFTGGPADAGAPAFFEGQVTVSGEPADTFLRLDAGPWKVGVAFVNGFNLGRYSREAPAPFDFYVPKSALREGQNQVVLLEMSPAASLTGRPAIRLDAQRAPAGPELGRAA